MDIFPIICLCNPVMTGVFPKRWMAYLFGAMTVQQLVDTT
jgi:hypothetical protein